MKIIRLILLAVLVGALSFAAFRFYSHGNENDAPANGAVPVAGSETEPPVESGINPEASPATRHETRPVVVLERGAADDDAMARELFSADPRLAALTADEAAWLAKHNYPTEEDLARLSEVDTKALKGTKDPWLATLQGLALQKQEGGRSGISVLSKAAALGSIYAYQQLALAEYEYSLAEFGGDRNGDSANILMARLEAAKILGDHTTQYLVDRYLPAYNYQRNAYTVQLQVAEFLRQLGAEAQLLGLPPPGPDPRPNAGLWNDLYELYKLPPPNQGGDGG